MKQTVTPPALAPPRIVDRERFLLLGLNFFGDPFAQSGEWTAENEIGHLWNRFWAAMASVERETSDDGAARPAVSNLRTCEGIYEVHLESPDSDLKGHFEVFVGIETDRPLAAPASFCLKVLPAATYAVFTLRGPQITEDWPRLIFEGWMAKSDYEKAHPFGFQLYDRRFKGMDRLAESEIDVYVPIRRIR